MTTALAHRGPDADGLWEGAQGRVVFGHRRLSILDLTPAGRQPMVAADGRSAICFNGEVYNFAALRRDLESAGAIAWRGHSDTEVMVEAIARWGVDRAVRCFNGMFAFAVAGPAAGTVTLARDRLGVKPLYVARSGDGALLFSSEARGLAADPEFPAVLNRAALPAFFATGYLPRGESIYTDTASVAPGALLTLADDAAAVEWSTLFAALRRLAQGPFDERGKGWHYRSYWSAEESWQTGRASPYAGDFEQAVAELEVLLTDAVRMRLESDVPLGALLSGGVDSSLVVALMQRQSGRRVRTFSIGFDDARFDESRHAEAVARHVGTEHTLLRLAGSDALAAAARIGELLDEPLADSSFVPTYLVSELTRRQVTVAMTGDGGDEFFGGYWRYREFRRLAPAYATPRWLRAAVDAIGRRWEIPLPPGRGPRWAWYRATRLLRLATQPDFAAAYRYATTSTHAVGSLLISKAGQPVSGPRVLSSDGCELAEWMMLHDVQNYLPDDLLVKMDRASMRVSLETREPLLDYRLHEFSARLPIGFKLESGAGKRVLRHVLYRHVPREIIDRPKQGFAVPLQRWLRDDLRTCAESVLFARDRAADLFQAREVERLWREHRDGRHDHGNLLWSLFVVRQWLATHRWN